MNRPIGISLYPSFEFVRMLVIHEFFNPTLNPSPKLQGGTWRSAASASFLNPPKALGGSWLASNSSSTIRTAELPFPDASGKGLGDGVGFPLSRSHPHSSHTADTPTRQSPDPSPQSACQPPGALHPSMSGNCLCKSSMRSTSSTILSCMATSAGYRQSRLCGLRIYSAMVRELITATCRKLSGFDLCRNSQLSNLRIQHSQ